MGLVVHRHDQGAGIPVPPLGRDVELEGQVSVWVLAQVTPIDLESPASLEPCEGGLDVVPGDLACCGCHLFNPLGRPTPRSRYQVRYEHIHEFDGAIAACYHTG